MRKLALNSGDFHFSSSRGCYPASGFKVGGDGRNERSIYSTGPEDFYPVHEVHEGRREREKRKIGGNLVSQANINSLESDLSWLLL